MIRRIVVTRDKKAYEKYAWILVVVGGVITLIFAVINIVFGGNIFQTGHGYPQAALNDLSTAQRVLGTFGLSYAILQIGIGVKAFRTGERWAWIILLSVPLGSAINSYLDVTFAGVSVALALFIFFLYGGLTLIGLLVSIRRFFPKQPATS